MNVLGLGIGDFLTWIRCEFHYFVTFFVLKQRKLQRKFKNRAFGELTEGKIRNPTHMPTPANADFQASTPHA